MALSSISSTDNIEYYRHRTRRRLLGFLRFVIVFYIMYELVTSMLVSSYAVASVSMSPKISPGDHLLVAPVVYGAPLPFTQVRFPPLHQPKRGEIVLVRAPYAPISPWYLRIANPVVEFFTGRTVRLGLQAGNSRSRLVVERVIGLPGDTIQMRDGVAYIEPAGSSVFSSELELIHGSYEIARPTLPKGWSTGLPMSGTTAPVKLPANDYFVVGDNRGNSSDSVAWGPLPARFIVGQVFFRYWPLGKMGTL